MKRSQSPAPNGEEDEDYDHKGDDAEGPAQKRGRGDGGGKRGRGGDGRACAFKVLCPDELTANLIGKNGSSRKAIEEDTGTKLKFSNRDSFFPSTRFRVVAITGEDKSNVLAAVDKILDSYIDYANREREEGKGNSKSREETLFGKDEGEYVFRTAIPKEAAGYIIGPGGAHIKAMRSETGAKVYVENETYDMHQMVRFIGNYDAIRTNVEKLLDGIVEDLSEEARMDWGQIVNVSDKGKGESKGKGKGGDRDRDSERHDWDQRGDSRDHRGDDRGKGDRGRGDRDYEDDRRRPTARGRSPPRNLKGPGGGAPPEMLVDLARQFPPEALELAHAVNCELPHNRIGSLIGRKGEYVNHVEKETGAKVVFSEAPKGEKTEHRTMSITGPLVAVYAAHMMMMKAYHEAERAEADRERERERESQRGSKKVENLQSQLADLQRQLEEAKKGGGGSGDGNSRSKGKGKR